jgi:hypothetical protein
MIMRRVRAALVISVTWGTVLSALGATLLLGGLALGLIPSAIFGPREVFTAATRAFLAGALGGMIFSGVLARAERRRTFDSLTARRAALWGLVGGVAIPAVAMVALGVASIVPLGVVVVASLCYGAIGSAIGAASVKLAHRAPELAEGTLVEALPAPPRSVSSTRSHID